jgi:hypothetical protein
MNQRAAVAAVGSTAVLVVMCASTADAQTDTQVWADMTLDWAKTHTLTLGLEIEPKVLVSKPADHPGWADLEITPSVEYAKGKWLDAIGELHFARTRQTDDQNSFEVSPRLGLRFHILSNIRDELLKERQPRRRLVLRDLFRVEWRNLFYSDETPQSSTLRIRDRIELQYPINRMRVTDDGALYATADAEWFWTHTDPVERFANKERVRAGIGQRWSHTWRTELLMVWDRSRNSAEDGFTTDTIAVDVRVRRVW